MNTAAGRWKKARRSGVHGLPLMGAGDWNDGMNRVGMAGRGESIWLGWFLHATLKRFAPLCELMKDDPRTVPSTGRTLIRGARSHAWDGDWYLRAFYDDGSPLGSHENSECQIDSIAQSWAVLSGAADPLRAAQAMESVNRLLVKQADQMILLFTPPFDKTAHDPGYIKGYLQVCAKMAGNTPMPPSGQPGRLPCSGRESVPGVCSAC